MILPKVKKSQIIKIALLLAVLVSLPRNIHVYNMISAGNEEFAGLWAVDFLYRLVFLFFFSWGILEINANIVYLKFRLRETYAFICIIGLDIVVLFLTLWVWKSLHPILINNPLSNEDEGFLAFGYVTLLVVLFFVARILRLQVNQRDSDIEYEHLKQQNLQNELAALKNQIDPHFLFNSLNSLASLIRENEAATQFVNKLSYMYRYILQSGDTDLVSIREELKFLESYSYLMKTRYRERFDLEVTIDEELKGRKIPPLALQLLVENAVKHNEISASHPLAVRIYSHENSLFVENPLRPRTTIAEGTGTGLLNLRKRYLLLQQQDVLISTEQAIFKVELPLRKLL
ncbi:MAG: histidine kinase [Maribacter sp.]